MPSTVPTEMTFVRIAGYGGPEVLQPDRMKVPEPGPAELLVRVAAAGINHVQVMHLADYLAANHFKE